MKSAKSFIRKTENIYDRAKLVVKNKLRLFDPVIIYPYRGYGNQKKAWLYGRVLEKEAIIHDKNELEETLWRNIRKFWKRFESDEIPGVGIKGVLNGFEARAVSDGEGYFTLEFEGLDKATMKNGWYPVDLQITDVPFHFSYQEKTTGEILICEQHNSFGIISDVDDTIIKSYATSKFNSVLTMIRYDAKSRTPFEGVSKLYKALIDNFKNPLFFVSGSSYNLYDLLIAFCEHHDIPKAPFFLRDIGLDVKQWIKQDTIPYKLDYIQRILDMYPKLSFILIGDSGQHDPEIYLEIHDKNPGRVKAIYIRHVHSDARKKALAKLSENLDVPFLLLDNSHHALNHAKEMGWIK